MTMSLSDSDLELLESHLDGELSVAEEEALRDRMNIEPELGAMLETLRAERDARRMAFVSMEPDDATVERFNRYASRELQRLDRESFWKRTSKTLRFVSAAAACLVIGFSVGRIMNSGVLVRTPGETGANNPNVVEVVLTDDSGHEIGVQRFPSRERATEFINDVDQWHHKARQQQQLMNDPNVIRTSAPEEQF
jgi:anti-sigma factor RsiW